MIVREAVLADARRIAHVHVLGWQAGYRGLVSAWLLNDLTPDQRLPRWTLTLEFVGHGSW